MDGIDPAREPAEEFGSGLRAHLMRRDEPLSEAAPAPPRTAPALREAPAATADDLALTLAELEERSARLAQLQADLEARERRLAAETAALDAAARLTAPPAPEPEPAPDPEPRAAAEALRDRLEKRIDLLWRTFEESLEATHPDGSPDYRTRLDAARMLLGTAYPAADAAPGSTPAADDQRLEDELARLRDRRLEWGQGS